MRLVVRICVVLLLVSSSSPQQQPTFRTQTNLVLVPVLVEDDRGHAVYGLSAQDFVVEDEGVAQPIRISEADESQPLAIVVAIQRGRSARFEYVRMKGLSTMLDPILSSQSAKIAIVEFDNEIQLARDFTNDDVVIAADLKRILGEQLGRWTPGPGEGGAPILDAVNYSLKLLAKVPNRQRVLLLISETRDHGSHFTKVEDILAAIGNTNATVFALTFSPAKTNVLDTLRGNNNDRWQPVPDLLYPLQEVAQGFRKNAAKEITSLTGGEYAEFSSHKAFDARLNDFTNHLHSRYLLSFEPKAPHPGLHHLKVSVSGPKNYKVVARSSYWANGS
jgi:VWFA-related protein